ncbi:MAG: ParB N-terminal domain-containing protein [Gemmataceae bacterium]
MKQASPNQPRRETIRMDQLVRHPKQDVHFGRPSPDAINALADDIRRNGLRELIEVLPPAQQGRRKEYQILSGHTRMEALALLNQTEAEVIVRYDLRDADADEVEYHLLEANQNRRHLDKLTQARIAKRLFLHEKRATRGRLSSSQQGELRELVGKIIGMSGRNLYRYIRVLDTPIEVQNAFRRSEVSLVVAERVADLGSRDQEEIAERIRSGQDARAVILMHLPPRRKGHVKVVNAVGSFVRALGRGMEDLSDRVDDIRPGQIARHARPLRDAMRFIGRLLEKCAGA